MRMLAVALGAVVVALALPATAQQVPGTDQNIYIDGRTPIDQRTRDLVDAYVIHKEQLDREEAERRERLQELIYHDRVQSGYNSSLY